jgi:hypothetical protein
VNIDSGVQKQVQALACCCILLTAFSLSYIGDDFGIWQRIDMEVTANDGYDTVSLDMIMLFKIQEVELEVDYDKDMENLGFNDDKENIEYGEGEDDDAMVDDMEDMMKNLRILLFLTVFAALGIIFFCNKEDIDNAKLLALMVVTISIVSGFYFWSGFTDSLEDTYDGNDSDYPLDLNGFQGNARIKETVEGIETEMKATWGPGIAWYLVTLVIPVLGGFVYFILDSYQKSTSLPSIPSTSLPSIPSMNGPANPLGFAQVQCSNCKILIESDSEYCPNCSFQMR